MNLKELALQNQKSCADSLLSKRNAQLLDDLPQNTRNLQRNTNATDSIEALKNIDSICNSLGNHSATVQKTTVQLLPLKTPQKLRTKNEELHTKTEFKSPVFGGSDSVILANSEDLTVVDNLPTVAKVATVAANDNLKLAAQIEPLNKVSPKFVPSSKGISEIVIPTPLGGGEAINPPTVNRQASPQIEDRQHPQIEEVKPEPQKNGAIPQFYGDERKISFNLARYSHCVTCNQCEHLSLTGSCTRLGKRVLPQALRECGSFQLLKSERTSLIEAKPYTQAELERLLNQAAKPLYHHLIDCKQCSLEDMRYCGDDFALGSRFDDLLPCFDDAANKRYLLMNQVIKARVSRRREFVPFSSD